MKLVVTVRAVLPADGEDLDVRPELGGSADRNRGLPALLSSLYDRQVSIYQTILDAGQTRVGLEVTLDVIVGG